ncbi:MAG: preprotein translocase subunit SecG [Tenuifilum sp.]|jgi:preprotein translocase subunit SecG|nr:preprotein translocase subunit SecG [Tenuifilum sp.]
MFTIIMTFVVIVSILLILIVLAQNPKGGGLSSTFAGSNQVMGARRTADFLEKATWYLAIALVALSLLATITQPKHGGEQKSVVESKVKENQPTALPEIPIPTEQSSDSAN